MEMMLERGGIRVWMEHKWRYGVGALVATSMIHMIEDKLKVLSGL